MLVATVRTVGSAGGMAITIRSRHLNTISLLVSDKSIRLFTVKQNPISAIPPITAIYLRMSISNLALVPFVVK
jgi:hypothetical protein